MCTAQASYGASSARSLPATGIGEPMALHPTVLLTVLALVMAAARCVWASSQESRVPAGRAK